MEGQMITAKPTWHQAPPPRGRDLLLLARRSGSLAVGVVVGRWSPSNGAWVAQALGPDANEIHVLAWTELPARDELEHIKRDRDAA
jgi:hypothetical protein